MDTATTEIYTYCHTLALRDALPIYALQEAGIDDLFVLHFDRAVSLKTAEAFVVEILVGDLAARHVVVGWDFCFGHKRAGNAGLLKSMGAQHGFGVTAVEPVMTGAGEVYSRSEEHTSELQSLMRISYAVFCLKNTKKQKSRSTADTIRI